MLAIRDDETRLTLQWILHLGLEDRCPSYCRLVGGGGGMLYTPQKSLINPKELSAFCINYGGRLDGFWWSGYCLGGCLRSNF